jgi:predicted nuclease of restriction endonuclease-like (RecB) superfamily
MTPDIVFKSPYFLEFLGLSDTFSEKDLENSILRELERFILELGTDFSFVARQKRIALSGMSGPPQDRGRMCSVVSGPFAAQ